MVLCVRRKVCVISPPAPELAATYCPNLYLFRLTALRASNVDVVTFGQYMRPTKRHMKVDRYVEPAEIEQWKQVAENMDLFCVTSGLRSSYKVSLMASIVP